MRRCLGDSQGKDGMCSNGLVLPLFLVRRFTIAAEVKGQYSLWI